jgi:FAD/FMN-containing dehydrogenase/Fe-S oxidoreductase
VPDPKQITDDLRGTFRGRLAFDRLARGLYSTDASPFQVTPLGVAVPADAADLAALVRYCFEHGIPIIPRGAGTGIAGESLGPALVVDLSQNFRRVLSVDADTVTVESGVVLAELNAELARHGRRFAPDPASAATCTVGGMVATNASGGNAFKYGYTRDHVRGLGVVWDDGTADDVGRGPAGDDVPRTAAITRAVTALLHTHRELIHLTRPHTAFNRCGYLLHDVLDGDALDLARLLVGSEGTLGFVTQATLKTVPLPGGTCVFLLGFPSLDAAVRAGLELRAFDPVSCDLLDRRLLSLTRHAAGGPSPGLIPPAVGAALVVTVEGDTEREALERGRSAADRLRNAHVLRVLADPTCDPDGTARIRAVREAAVAGLYALGPGPRPVAFVEDVGVPADHLPEFLTGVQAVLQRFELTGSLLVHALTGQVHTRPLIDLGNPDDRAKLWPVAEIVHELALKLGGTVSTQHGTGIARTPWVEKQYGPLMPVFREVKRIFDPKSLLNPGKIIGPDPSRPAWPLRSVVSGQWSVVGEDDGRAGGVNPPVDPPPARTPLLLWRNTSPAAEAAKCTGCGDCRTRTTGRMCPVFRATGGEEAAPRAKANLFHLLTGDADLGAEDVRQVAELCVGCRMCRDECPARVDVSKLMYEAKAAHQAEHGLDRADWVLARAEGFAATASNFAPLVNGLLARRSVRWLVEKLFGVSRTRRLPAFALRNFFRRARGQGFTRKPRPGEGRRVAYFVDTFAAYNDPLVGAAAVGVLRHNGVEVYVPPRQVGCGMAPLARGDADAARDAARRNVRVLADLVREGYRVVCSEPTAALMLSQDYPDLVDDPDVGAVAANTTELTTFLWDLHAAGRLRTDFRRLDVTLGHHVPCHLKALRGPASGPGLLGLVPGVSVHTIDVSCSGMAGTWGLKAANHATSLAAGRPMLAELDRPGVLYGSTECSACRLQMQEGTGKRTLHPVQYLAYAYGLLPEIGPKLHRPLGELVTD